MHVPCPVQAFDTFEMEQSVPRQAEEQTHAPPTVSCPEQSAGHGVREGAVPAAHPDLQ